MKKILIFIPASVGGAERVGVTIGKILKKHGNEVHFVIFGDSCSPINSILPVYCKRHYINNNYLRWYRMNTLIRRESADIVFAPCRTISRDLVMATKLLALKCKVIVRSDNPLHTLKPLNRWLIRRTFKYADSVIAQQEEMMEEIVNEYPVPANKVVVLHNPIDYEAIDEQCSAESPYKNCKENEVRYVWVARVSESKTKGHDYLLKAFQKVHERIPNAHLYCVGAYKSDGVFFRELIDYINTFHLENNVHFVGFDSNPHRWVKNADCFVLPSRVEGLPNAMIEAMYLGKPVVATRCLPIIERIIQNGRNGYFVKVGDIDAMADAMEKALELKEISFIYNPSLEVDIVKIFNN